MGKLKELQTVKKLVTDILERDQRARNSDSYLYLKVLEVIAKEKGIDLSQIMVPVFLTEFQGVVFPPFETVRRNRQILQAARADLQASDEIAEARAVNEQAFFDFARG